ncbi:MAG: Hsp70 family protein [Planctomycetota bacterium]
MAETQTGRDETGDEQRGDGDGGVIVGIDLGTTNSLVAVYDADGPRVLVPEGESALVPSAVRYEADDASARGVRAVVGDDASARAVEFPSSTITSVKRLMGRSLADARADLPYLGYTVAQGERSVARVVVPSAGGSMVDLTPQEVSADILRALRARAESVLGHAVEKAVVTVPAYFDDAQRQATRDAGRIAGIEVVRIVNEPTAAALAYGIGLGRAAHASDRAPTVAVYDLGGGTFDVSILRLTDAGDAETPAMFEVLSTAGDTRLGGDDVDHLLVSLFTSEMRAQLGLPEPAGEDGLEGFEPATRRALKAFATAVKHRLSTDESAAVEIAINEAQTYRREITRGEFERLITPWVERTGEACRRALRDARDALDGDTIDAAVLVGGSTRIPLVRRVAGEIFGVEPYTALDPDRVVALGAAVQAGVLSGAAKGALLLDVIPLSLGIETRGGAVAKLIVRNSAVPARATEMFSTSVDGQTNVTIRVLQGEREMAEDCRDLGTFELRGIPPMPAGIPQVEVVFAVDANGVLRITAHERRSGKRAELEVIPRHGLTEGEVERIEAESLEHAREDMTRHRIVDLVVNSRLDLKWIGERLEKFGGKLDDGVREQIQTNLQHVRTMVEAGDADWRSVDANAFHAAKQRLDESSVPLQEIGIAESLRGD